MTSKTIYGVSVSTICESADHKFHYVYRITNLAEGKHYYGKRSTKTHPYQDLGSKYFSSSHDKEFIKLQKTNPEQFKYKIVAVFDTANEAVSLEVKLHNKFDVGVNRSFYNRVKQTSTGWDTTGLVSVRDEDGNTLQVPIDHPDYVNGILVGVTIGKATGKDSSGNFISVDLTDPLWTNRELVGTGAGYVRCYNSVTGKSFRIEKDSKILESPEIVRTTGGYKGYHNVEIGDQVYLPPNAPVPPGYIPGKLPEERVWYFNPTTEERRLFDPDTEIPSGWIEGRGEYTRSGKVYYRDPSGTTSKLFFPGEQPKGWVRGKCKMNMRGRVFYYDPVTDKCRRFLPGEEPEGWVRGKGINGKKFYHNPKTGEYKMFFVGEEPEEWVFGRGTELYFHPETGKQIHCVPGFEPVGYVLIPNKSRGY